MKSRKGDLVLGLVTLAMIGLGAGSILFIDPLYRPETRAVNVYFSHEAGMAPVKPGSPVMLGGAVQVGKVTSVQLTVTPAALRDRISDQLCVAVSADVDRMLTLYEDCQIATDQPPVGGAGVLVIADVGSPHLSVVAQQPLAGLPPRSLASAIGALSSRVLGPGGLVDKLDRQLDDGLEGTLMFKLQASLDDVNEMTRSLRTELSPLEQRALMAKVHRITESLVELTTALASEVSRDDGASLVAKVHLALDHLADAVKEAGALVQDNRPGVSEVVNNLSALTGNLNAKAVPAVLAELDRSKPDALLTKLHVSMDRLNASLANVVEISAGGRAILASNRPAIERTIGNLKEASDQLRLGIQELLLTPWRLFQTPADRERYRIEAFEAARRFAEAATSLDDAAARLDGILAAAGSNGAAGASPEEVAAIQASLKLAFERFRTAEEFLWEKMK